MTARDQFKKVQKELGMPLEKQDGIPGSLTDSFWNRLRERALANKSSAMPDDTSKILEGSPGWSFTAFVDGEDIVLRDVSASFFGGPSDNMDDGQTASGVDNTKLGVMGCALPVIAGHKSTKGSPLAFSKNQSTLRPSIPWKTQVEVTYKGKTITVPLIDNGPAKSARDPIDLTPSAFTSFPGVKQKVGIIYGVDVRIIDAAKYIGV